VAFQSHHLSIVREAKSPLDRHAIDTAGRLLTTGVWLECQFKNSAKRGAGLVERSKWSEPVGRAFQMCVAQINQPRNEES
jgi:hypothetical protein